MSQQPQQEVSQNELEKQRLEKLRQIREKNIEVYPPRFEKKDQIAEIRHNYFSSSDEVPAGTVQTAGRIVALRPMGKAAFFTIGDENDRIQVYGNSENLSEEEYYLLQHLDLGDIVGVLGEPFRTKTGEPSLRAKQLTMLAKNLSPLPVVKEKDGIVYDAFSDIEQRYRKRYVDLNVTPKSREDFRVRSAIVREIRNFLHGKGFMEVETPMMQAIASGAAAKPFVTHHNTLDMDLFLRIAPELFLKRLIVGGYEKVFELNRNFRNEGISTKHNPEFTMMEIYQAYADYETMMRLTEDLFVHLADTVIGSRQIPYGEHTINLSAPWEKKGYLEIIKEKTGADFSVFLGETDPSFTEAEKIARAAGVDTRGCHTFWEIVDAVFSEKVEPNLIQPIFITHYPKAISPLAKSIPGNEHLVERFEPYITGREMGNAFSELNDPQEQLLRFQEQLHQKEQGAAETMELDEDFIEALRVGMPPTGGLGIGIDRLVMLFTNNPSIKDVILFPLLRKREN